MSTLNLSIIVKAVDKVTAPLRGIARGAGIFERAFRGAHRSLQALARNTGLDRLAREAARATRAVGGVGTALAGVAGRGAAAGGLLAGGLFGFKRVFFDTAAHFETLQVMLKAVEGSSEKAKVATDWIVDFAARTPLELDDVTQAYIKLKNFGIDPTQGALQTLVNQNALMGGGASELEGLILALGQAWTKSKLQGEEALQLIERGVPVWDLLAKRLGKTTAEVMKMSEQGKLGRKEIQMLMEEIARRSAGAADAQSKTAEGIISNLFDYWTKIVNLIMSSGAFDWIKGQLQTLLSTIQAMEADGRLAAWAKRVGTAVLEALQALDRFLFGYDRLIGGDGGELEHVAGLFEQLSDGVRGLVEWVQPLIDRFGAGKLVMAALAALIAGPLLGAIATLTTALITLGVAALGALGWIVIPIAAIAYLAWRIIDNWSEISGFFERLWDLVMAAFRRVGDWITGAWRDGIAGTADFLGGIWTKVTAAWAGTLAWVQGTFGPAFSAVADTIRDAWEAMRTWFNSLWDGLVAKFRSAIDQIKNIWNEVAGFFDRVVGFVSGDQVMSEGDAATLLNNGQALREALNGPDYIPGERPGAAAARKLLGTGQPQTGAAAVLAAQGGAAGGQRVENKNTTEVVITGRNLPPGISVTPGRSNADSTRLDLGYSMVTP